MLGACIVAGVLLGGCGGEGDAASDATAPASSTSDTGSGSAEPVEKKTIDPATVGSLSGVVSFDGDPGTPEVFKLVGEAYCIHEHPDGWTDDRLQVQDGYIANAFVWIKSGLEGYEFPTPTETIELDQQGCLYSPRVIGVQVGQPLIAKNSDPIMHNVHTKPEKQRGQNRGQPEGAPPMDIRLRRPEVMVEVRCDVHAWMKAWIGVVPHPFFAVTGADGTFHFDGLPPGTYTVEVWHETLGRQEAEVTIGENGDVTLEDFVYEA